MRGRSLIPDAILERDLFPSCVTLLSSEVGRGELKCWEETEMLY